MDVVLGLAEALPSGMYSGSGIEDYVREVLSDPDRTDDFRLLEHELYLAATDLDTCERIVFGANDWDDVPISTAVRASTALPMVYKPVRVKDRELVDGGIVSTTNLDIAVEAGAKFVIVVNPLVPYVNDFSKTESGLLGTRVRHISDMGFPQIGYQSFKLLAYQRLHEMARQWEQRYPGVDIVLVEPEPNDELMFQTSIMNFTSRVEIARHGFESVTLKLAEDYGKLREVCERHGIEISATRVRKVVKHFAAEKESTRAWRKILEQTTGTLLRQSAGDARRAPCRARACRRHHSCRSTCWRCRRACAASGQAGRAPCRPCCHPRCRSSGPRAGDTATGAAPRRRGSAARCRWQRRSRWSCPAAYPQRNSPRPPCLAGRCAPPSSSWPCSSRRPPSPRARRAPPPGPPRT